MVGFEHTHQIAEVAHRVEHATDWLARTRNSALLLRGPALTSAEGWKDARPAKAPVPPVEVLDLILASRQAATQQQRWWIGGAMSIALGASALAGVAVWQRGVAVEQTGIANTASEEAKRQAAEADRQAKVADARREETVKLRQETQVTEAGLLSQAAKEVVGSDPGTAMLLALEGMPDANARIERPVVAEASVALDNALRARREHNVFGHLGSLDRAVLSSDGKLLVTAVEDPNTQQTTIWLREVASGRVLFAQAHAGKVDSAAFSPDGKMLVTASRDNTARLFDVTSGRELFTLAHVDNVSGAAFSPDGKLLAAGSSDATARIFDVASGRELLKLVHNGRVSWAAFSPDGRVLATVSDDGARLFEVQSGKEQARLALDATVNRVVFGQDGTLLATILDDATVRLIEVPSGR